MDFREATAATTATTTTARIDENHNPSPSSASNQHDGYLHFVLNKPISVLSFTPNLLCNLTTLQAYPTLTPQAATTFIRVRFSMTEFIIIIDYHYYQLSSSLSFLTITIS